MFDPLNLSPWMAIVLAIVAFAILEVLFLLARCIEGERSLHQLRVRSHTLRLEMKRAAAAQMYDEWKWEMKRTGKSWEEVVERSTSDGRSKMRQAWSGESNVATIEEPDLTSPRPEDVAVIVDDDREGSAKQAA